MRRGRGEGCPRRGGRGRKTSRIWIFLLLESIDLIYYDSVAIDVVYSA